MEHSGKDRIRFVYSSIDGVFRHMVFETKTAARDYAQSMLGRFPEISMAGYAVSDDGIGKISDLKNITWVDLFPPPQPMTNKSEEVKSAIEDMFPGTAQAIQEHKCPMCKNPIGEFRDALSRKEYRISGMCQNCQDKAFGSPDDIPY